MKKTIRKSVQTKTRRLRAKENREGFLINLGVKSGGALMRDRRKLTALNERQLIMRRLTNWQRNQAGKACKGAFHKISMEKLLYYMQLERPSNKLSKNC